MEPGGPMAQDYVTCFIRIDNTVICKIVSIFLVSALNEVISIAINRPLHE
jgi:hypothetical protein